MRDGSVKGKENAPGAVVPEQVLHSARVALEQWRNGAHTGRQRGGDWRARERGVASWDLRYQAEHPQSQGADREPARKLNGAQLGQETPAARTP